MFIVQFRSTPKHGECLQRKKTILEHLENKLEMGIDRSLTAIVGYVKATLQTEQKKSDFKPEGDDAIVNIATPVNIKYTKSPCSPFKMKSLFSFKGMFESLSVRVRSD